MYTASHSQNNLLIILLSVFTYKILTQPLQWFLQIVKLQVLYYHPPTFCLCNDKRFLLGIHVSDTQSDHTASSSVKPSLVPRARPLNPLDDEETLFMIEINNQTGEFISADGKLCQVHVWMYSAHEGNMTMYGIFIYVMSD